MIQALRITCGVCQKQIPIGNPIFWRGGVVLCSEACANTDIARCQIVRAAQADARRSLLGRFLRWLRMAR